MISRCCSDLASEHAVADDRVKQHQREDEHPASPEHERQTGWRRGGSVDGDDEGNHVWPEGQRESAECRHLQSVADRAIGALDQSLTVITPEDEGLFKAAPQNRGAPLVELTYNWDEEKYGEDRHFGHLAYEVDDIYATCDRLMKAGITINRPPRDGNMAFVRSPDLHSIELLQKGEPKPPAEPWTSMPNTGHW